MCEPWQIHVEKNRGVLCAHSSGRHGHYFILCVLAGLLCCIMPGLSSLIGVPMMWHWVGGGFSAMHGTVACFLFVVHVDGWLEGTPPLVRKFSFVYRLASPLLYARAVLSLRGWLELLVFLGIDAWVYSAFTSPSSADDETGASCCQICHYYSYVFF